ncbi:hypothetical protein LCGC14_1079520 [marine sediment metagenome]|uniref:Uncharacterized protein n=1 Tax=marine sediment metagenome TaxID=412755 RepID=A0A0F9MFS6_9ZZZZ|nr:MAG: hypothetical protein Lokiarch_05760 [Candidatus Lokiarchaeum sp. GC14_75]
MDKEERRKLQNLDTLKRTYRTDVYIVDIEIFTEEGKNKNEWIQGKYLIHGLSDVYWVNNIDDVLKIIKKDLEKYKKE